MVLQKLGISWWWQFPNDDIRHENRLACCCRNGFLLVGSYYCFSLFTQMDCQTCPLFVIILYICCWCTYCFMVFLINVKSTQGQFRMENCSRWWCYCFCYYFLLCYICLLLMVKYFYWSLNFSSSWRFSQPHNSSCPLPNHFLRFHVPNHCLVGINYFLFIQYGRT